MDGNQDGRDEGKMAGYPKSSEEEEVERILNMSDEEIMAEHLAEYGGDKKLAQKALDMMRTNFREMVNRINPWKN